MSNPRNCKETEIADVASCTEMRLGGDRFVLGRGNMNAGGVSVRTSRARMWSVSVQHVEKS